MKNSLRFTPLALLLCLTSVQAQPDAGNAPKAQNPTNRPARPGANATPEERLAFVVKLQFARLGADEATQAALVTFVQQELQARQDLQEKSQPLQDALRAGALPDAQFAALLNTYQGALEDEKTRRAQAIDELQKAIDFKKSPKIEAALTLVGLIGDGPLLNLGGGMGRAMMGGRGGAGGMGAGGMGAGGRGGQNGRGGRNNRGNNAPAANAAPAQGA